MTREELKAHCERQIQQFERVEKIMPVTLNDWKRYEEHKLILELLEQETAPFDFELYKAGLMDMPKGMIEVLDNIIAEIKEWYWQADKQALAKDPCVVDAMIDLFIRTIDKYKAEK